MHTVLLKHIYQMQKLYETVMHNFGMNNFKVVAELESYPDVNTEPTFRHTTTCDSSTS